MAAALARSALRGSYQAALVFVVALLLVATVPRELGHALLRAVGHALVVQGAAPSHADVVAVHGGGGPGGAREGVAVSLLAERRAEKIVALGGLLPADDPDRTYAGAAARRLRALGAPDSAVVQLAQGSTTGGELAALKAMAADRGWTTIVLTTSSWHTRRVQLLAARTFAGTRVRWTVVAPATSDVDLDTWWRSPSGRRVVLGEWLKMVPSLLGLDGEIRSLCPACG